MKSIIWLASYPKSGNTWLRIFLANYIHNRDQPVPINQVHKLGIGDAIASTYRLVSKGAFDPANPQHTTRWRDAVLRGIVGNKADVNFVKTHNENGTAFGTRLIPREYTRAAIYILRNPMDMAISYASHYGQTLDQAIESAGRTDNVLVGRGENAFQFLGNWSNHVQGWSRSRDFPVLTLRYEDLLDDPVAGFGEVVSHIGLPNDQARLKRAVEFSSFKELRAQEDTAGFIENSDNQQRFFRSGSSGQWETALNADQIARMRKSHGTVMKRFGYL